MPFPYYGAKHGLWHKYPPPAHGTIVEPFAGSAAYALNWSHQCDVILVEKNSYIVQLWQRLQTMTPNEVNATILAAVRQPRTNEPLVAFSGGSSAIQPLVEGHSVAVTPRMMKDAPNIAARINYFLPRIRNWTILQGDYSDAPDIQATWFVDPPYQPHHTIAGLPYGSAEIDYTHLGEWCRSRQGQTIVCEQLPAAWLPFRRLATQKNAVNKPRHEVIWTKED